MIKLTTEQLRDVGIIYANPITRLYGITKPLEPIINGFEFKMIKGDRCLYIKHPNTKVYKFLLVGEDYKPFRLLPTAEEAYNIIKGQCQCLFT